MNKKDAIRAMLDGKKVRHESWADKKAFQYFDETDLQFRVESSTSVRTGLPDGWEIYEEFTYPMWFKDRTCEIIVRFDSLDFGEVIRADDEVSSCKVGDVQYHTEHTNSTIWVQVEEPTEQKTVTIKKWLMSDSKGEGIWIGHGNASYFSKLPSGMRKVKLLDSYEVTL